MNLTIKTGILKWSVVAVGMCLLGTSVHAAPYVVLKNGKKQAGITIKALRDGSIILETTAGSQKFSKDQVVRAVADRPPEIASAQQKMKAKDFQGAVGDLEKVVTDYRFLQWDIEASKLLMQVYPMVGNHAKVIEMYEALDEADVGPSSQIAYFQALLNQKKYDKLDGLLDKTIASGERSAAAVAQNIRGDIKVAQGDMESAVLDYLKTALVYKSEKEAHPEALYKAAEALEKLRDPRAKDFYQKVLAYPASPYTEKAKQKL